MSDAMTVAKNAIYLTIAQAILVVTGIISMKLTTTGLQSTGYGLFGYATSLNTIICSFMDLGLGTLASREVSRDKSQAHRYLSNFLLIRLVFAVIVLAGIYTAAYIGLIPVEARYVVFIVALSVIFNILTGLFVGIFQAYERMEYISAQTAITSVLTMLAAALMSYFNLDVVGYSLLYCLAYLAVLVYCIAVCARKFTMPGLEFDAGFWKDSIAESLPFGITYVFGVIYYQFATIVLQYTHSWRDVGIFKAPFNLFMTVLFVPQVLTTALFPVMSRYFITSRGSFKKAFDKFLKYIIIISIPMGVGTTILADKIMYTLSNAQYTDSIFVLQILIWAAVFLFICSVYISLMNSSNKQRTTMMISFTCLVLNVALCILLIPTYSYMGAAVAITVTEFIELAIYIIVSIKHDYGPSKASVAVVAKAAAASALMGCFLIYFRAENLLLLVAVGVALYFLALYILKTFDREDIDIIRQIIGSRIKTVQERR
ncbi:MAG TPA: flippase [Methanocella sp.]|uniref:flippase n=1 Tax=Methanocella sp. TaxID=2052833 RepID=UPI002B8A06AB|nr:flippase [Methanocella sp.]HTY91604.1 flippase [Methanocella sp.]